MSARILVVDDVDVNLRLLEAKLTIEYYDVLTCNNGATALALAYAYRFVPETNGVALEELGE